MDSRQYLRASEIFLAAADLPPPERAALVERECATDRGLRRLVESLLAGDSHAPAELDAPAVNGVDLVDLGRLSAAAEGQTWPERIGPYRVLGVLGTGGMGIVYAAEQDQPRRQVALKVIRPGVLGDQYLRRFEHEAQVLGWLNHPGIAQIYEAGTADAGFGRQPYFAMELIVGRPLNEYVRDERLGIAQRLELFARVCDAVHHAHQKGVIHRDLKPTNILVDAQGQPKVLDFGVARVTDADLKITTLQTDAGQLVGTLSYMSPEQVAADPAGLDTRSDVYALGVLLYELLAGRLPYDVKRKQIHEAVRVILEEEPSKLSSVDRNLRGDVETIVSKAVEKDKQRRYSSAEELASDVRRFLRNEPIVARPPSTLYQLSKFTRRNRVLVGGVVAVFVVLLAGVTVSSLALIDARRNLARAELAEAQERQKAETAERVRSFLVDLFSAADPNEARGRDVTARELLQRGSTRILEGLDDQPEVQASLMDAITSVQLGLGLFDEALPLARRALEIRRDLHPDEDHLDLAQSLERLAGVHSSLDRPAEALPLLEASLGMRERLQGPEHRDVAAVHSKLGYVHKALGDPLRAEEEFRRGLELQQSAREPDELAVAEARVSLAFLLSTTMRWQEATELLEAALAVYEREPAAHVTAMADALGALGWTELYQERPERAREHFERALELLEGPLERDHPQLLLALYNLGSALAALGELAEAEHLMTEAHEGWLRYGETHEGAVAVLSGLAQLKAARGDPRGAVELLEELFELDLEKLGEHHLTIPGDLRTMAFLLSDLGEYDRAERMHERARAIFAAQLGPGHWRVGNATLNLAELASAKEEYVRAEELFREAIEQQRSDEAQADRENGPEQLAMGLNGLGWMLLQDLERAADAEPLFSEALTITLGRENASPEDLAMARTALGWCLVDLERWQEAEPHLREARDLCRNQGARPEIPLDLMTRLLVRTLEAQGRHDEANEVRTER